MLRERSIVPCRWLLCLDAGFFFQPKSTQRRAGLYMCHMGPGPQAPCPINVCSIVWSPNSFLLNMSPVKYQKEC